MGKTVIKGNFEWDEEKNIANIQKHGFGFERILGMFDSPFFWEQYDEGHSEEEETRFHGIAIVDGLSVVVSCYTERGRIRIISARRATASERRMYYERLRNLYS